MLFFFTYLIQNCSQYCFTFRQSKLITAYNWRKKVWGHNTRLHHFSEDYYIAITFLQLGLHGKTTLIIHIFTWALGHWLVDVHCTLVSSVHLRIITWYHTLHAPLHLSGHAGSTAELIDDCVDAEVTDLPELYRPVWLMYLMDTTLINYCELIISTYCAIDSCIFVS